MLADQVTHKDKKVAPKRRKQRQVIVTDVWPQPGEATYPSVDAAIEAAIPFLTALIGPEPPCQSEEAA
jgi:hypothetical protein